MDAHVPEEVMPTNFTLKELRLFYSTESAQDKLLKADLNVIKSMTIV